jgi:hypothetical protein
LFGACHQQQGLYHRQRQPMRQFFHTQELEILNTNINNNKADYYNRLVSKRYPTKRYVMAREVHEKIKGFGLAQLVTSQWVFVLGAQTRVERTTTRELDVIVFSRPEKAIDWLKTLITEWEPTLKFGWLVPKNIEIKVHQRFEEEATYLNVLPLPNDMPDRGMMEFGRFSGAGFVDFDEISLLDGEPPTKKEIKEEQLKGRDIAAYMAMYNRQSRQS